MELTVLPFICRSCRLQRPLLSTLRSRQLHASAVRLATPLPITATGPPPAPPSAASEHGERVDCRKRQAELVKDAQFLRDASKPSASMKKRFWKSVSIQESEEGLTVLLDTRPVRNPLSTPAKPLKIPHSKPQLATAIALEWDLITSAADALRSHLIPLTSIASRAESLVAEDKQAASEGHTFKGEGTRYDIVNNLLRYLDTDTLLCWAPERKSDSKAEEESKSLRDTQIEVAKPILSFLTQNVWPGVELIPSLADGSILPKSQPASTRAVVRGWMAGLPAWELVGLERAVLAGKSLCVGARLVSEWSDELRMGVGEGKGEGDRFGIEQAAKACSLEVEWQTGMWGEVEDTHDVDKEDLRRQLGSVVLLVSGTKGR